MNDLTREIKSLYPIYEKTGKNMAVFLLQAITMHADDATLERIIADVREEITHASAEGASS
ncbi:MAG TPA: hypothetical protein VNK94_07290 [Gaiellaceae bacterium]|nr:hypothetical protein [Gaiellaceae bacterium]